MPASDRQFKPGQSGNPGGRPALPPEIRAERKSNQSALISLISKFFAMTPMEAKEHLTQPGTCQLERAVQSMIGKSIEGDVKAFKYLMEVMVGRIPEHDYDGFTEEEIRILNRVKEIFSNRKSISSESSDRTDH